MASERLWSAIPTTNFISNGGTEGQVTLLSTRGIKVKMKVIIDADSPSITATLEVKKVVDEYSIVLGPAGKAMRGPGSTSDLTQYTIARNARLRIDEQERPAIVPDAYNRAVYEEEPVVAVRTIGVGPLGQIIDDRWDGIVPQEFDDVQITRDDDGDVVEAQFFLRTEMIADILLEYDLNKDVVRAYDAMRVEDVG